MAILQSVIVRSAGKPIAGALVIWWDQSGRSDARTTDGSGFCNFGNLTSAGITMSVQASGYKLANFYKTDDDVSLLVELEPSATPFTDAMLPLHIEGRYFVDSSGTRWNYKGCSEFCLFKLWVLGGTQMIEELVNERLSIFGEGLVFRAFRYAGGSNTFAMNPSWDNARLDAAINLCKYLRDKHARIDFTAGDAQMVLPNANDQQHEVNAFYEAISNEPNAFFQTCNEPGKNGVDVQRIKPPKGAVLRSSGNYDASYGDATFANTMLDFLDFHSVRDGLDTPYPKAIWDPLEQMYADYVTFPIVNGEPFGFAEQLIPGRRSNKPIDAKRLATDRKMWDLGVTFHSDNGIRGEMFQPITKSCAQSFVDGLRWHP